MPSEKTRAYIYRILVALGSLLGILGFITGEQTVAILGVAAALLNVLPTMNTTTKPNE